MTIPRIAAGAKVSPIGEIKQPVRIIDTALTLAHVLDVLFSEKREGHPIMRIF